MTPIMMSILFTLAFVVSISILGVQCGRGAIQFRLTEEEFSKVSKVLLSSSDSYVSYNDEPTLIKGSTPTALYSITQLNIDSGEPVSVNVSIPKDDHLTAMTDFVNMSISGLFTINSMSDQFVLRVPNVSIKAEGKVQTVGVVGPNKHILLSIPHCSVMALVLDLESLPNFIVEHMTEQELSSIFNNTICQLYYMKYSLGFGECSNNKTVKNSWWFGQMSLNLGLMKVMLYSHAVYLQIKNSTIMVTQMLQTTVGERVPNIPGNDDDIPEFPPLRENSEPFEMWIKEDIFSDIWKVFKRESKLESSPRPLSELFPFLSDFDDIDTGRIPYMFSLYKTYPNATGTLYINDAEIQLSIKEDDTRLVVSTTGSFVVTLNCDRKRTYSAFYFHIICVNPTLMAVDNKFITFKLVGYGGNMTIINSSIGHVANRYLSVIFYNLPQLFDPHKAFASLNEKISGIEMNQLLPIGLYMQRQSLRLEQGHIVSGGELTDVDPKLSRISKSNLNWIGDLSILDELYFPLIDLTPVNLTATPTQNCSKSFIRKETSSANSVEVINISTCMLCMLLSNLLFIL